MKHIVAGLHEAGGQLVLARRDQGAAWKLQGNHVDGTIGPMIDAEDEKRFAIAGSKGIFHASDGGQTWGTVTSELPLEFSLPTAGWCANVAWDPVHDLYCASQMGQPTYRLSP